MGYVVLGWLLPGETIVMRATSVPTLENASFLFFFSSSLFVVAGLSTLRGEALMSDLRKATVDLIKLCGFVRSNPSSAGGEENVKDSIRNQRLAIR